MPNFNNSKSSTDGQGTFAWNFGKPESPKDEQDSFAWNFGKPEFPKDEHDTLVRNFGRELDIAEDRLAKKRCFVSESMNETARQWAQENNHMKTGNMSATFSKPRMDCFAHFEILLLVM